VKAKIINLMTSIRTLMRSMLSYFLHHLTSLCGFWGGCGDGEKGEMPRMKGHGRKLGRLIWLTFSALKYRLLGSIRW
jgi:hypothetical protein